MTSTPLISRRGFTLSEILVTTTISALVLGATAAFFTQQLNIYTYDMGKNRVNRDIRAFTSELTDNATYANGFQIFTSFSNRSYTESVTVGETTTVTTNSARVGDGLTGDMLVLYFRDPNDDDLNTRLIGYYRAPVDPTLTDPNDQRALGPVRKFDITLSPPRSAKLAEIYTLLPDVSTYGTHEEVIELSKGLANGKLFYNIRDKLVMVNGQIIHRGGLGKTRYERATNTYNFTISPRG
jgi:prepilin-type N-terminal cleavage/methylation domain-containing protein